MKTQLIATLLLLMTSALSAFSAPEPGRYLGTLTIKRSYEGLSSSYTLKAQAAVKPDGTITILTSAPELPSSAAANLEAATTRATPIAAAGEPTTRTHKYPPPAAGNINGPGYNYTVDEQWSAFVTARGRTFTLHYQSPPPIFTASPGSITVILPPKSVSFQFTFRRQ